MGTRKPFVWRAWTAEEEAALRELAGVLPAAEIARRLGRTEGAVHTHAQVMGVRLRVIRP